MLKYLPYAVQALFVIGGLSLGLWLKSGLPPASHEPSESSSHKAENAHGDKNEAKAADKKQGHSKKKSGGHGKASDTKDSSYGYLKFSRQFVVPIIGASGVRSLVVMDINIEVPPDATEGAYTLEPKLRDSLLGALLQLSNKGAFSERILEQANLDGVRSDLLKAARTVIGDDAQNILILSIARQDV